MTINTKRAIGFIALAVLFGALFWVFVVKPEPISADRYVEPDRLFQDIAANVRSDEDLDVIVDIDHSRLAADAGSPMPPSHVLIYSDSELEAGIVEQNPLAAVDLPLRVLAYEDQKTGEAKVIANSYDFISRRHSLPDSDELHSRYDAAIDTATKGIPDAAIAKFPTDTMSNSGLITLVSPYNLVETERRVIDAINSQGDTVIFGMLDFAERSKKHGVSIPPLRMVLFGGPGPGGKAMMDAPTLGLDAFCQKLVIWQDADGTIRVAFNDLLALAERQDVPSGLPLRIINRRLKTTFSTALDQ